MKIYLSQLVVGAIIGVVAAEILRDTKPEILEKVKENAKGFTRVFESIYKEVKGKVGDMTKESQGKATLC